MQPQLQIIHLLNLPYNLQLTRGLSAIAEPLVSVISDRKWIDLTSK